MFNKKRIIVASVLGVAISVSFLCGKTFSKYVTAIEGEGSTKIAKWSFLANGEQQKMKTITLGKETNNKIFPGSKGEFSIEIDASGSEVGIEYQVEISEERNKPTNLKFQYEGKSYDNMKELSKELSRRNSGRYTRQKENHRNSMGMAI